MTVPNPEEPQPGTSNADPGTAQHLETRRSRREAGRGNGRAAGGGSVARHSATMAIGTLGSRVLGFIRTAMLTAVVGGALAADSFTVANSLPTQVYVLINGGLLSALIVPQITKAMARKDGSQDFTDRLLTLAFLVLAGVTAVCLPAAPWIVDLLSANKNPDFLSLTTAITYICMPQVFFYGLYSVLGQVLNAYGRFSAFAWAPAWANVIQIAGLAYFIREWGQQPTVTTWTPAMIWVLAGTTTLGIVVQGVCLIVPLIRSGFRYRPRFGWRGYGFGDLSRMAGWTIAALTVSQLGGLVTTRAMTVGASQAANVAGNGVQQYAYSLYTLPHSLITVSIVTALFPAMSRAFQEGDLAGLRRWVVTGLTAPAVLVIPSATLLIALGRPMASALFPGLRVSPALGLDEPGDVATVLALMAIGILPFGITALKQRYCFARGDGWLNFWQVGVMTLGNLITAVVAMVATPPAYVVAVVAAGGTISNIVAAGLFLVIARRQLEGLALRGVWLLWLRLTAAATVAGLVAWGTASYIAAPTSRWLWQALALGVGTVAFGLVFLAASWALRISEVTAVLTRLTSRLTSRLGSRPGG